MSIKNTCCNAGWKAGGCWLMNSFLHCSYRPLFWFKMIRPRSGLDIDHWHLTSSNRSCDRIDVSNLSHIYFLFSSITKIKYLVENVGCFFQCTLPFVPFTFSANSNRYIGWSSKSIKNVVKDLIQNCATWRDDRSVWKGI
jgi:hypothetical protein